LVDIAKAGRSSDSVCGSDRDVCSGRRRGVQLDRGTGRTNGQCDRLSSEGSRRGCADAGCELRRSVAATGLAGLHIAGVVDIQAGWTSAHFAVVACARHLAVVGSRVGVGTEAEATPALGAVLSARIRVATGFAGSQADLSRHARAEILARGIRKGPAVGRVVVDATKRCIVGDVILVDLRPSSVFVDGYAVVSTAGLRVVARAAIVALRLADLGAHNSVATKADAIVLQTSIAEAVALADGPALLNGHVVHVGVAAEAEGIGIALSEAAHIIKRSNRIRAGRALDVVSQHAREQSGCESNSESVEGTHDAKSARNGY
jgi:hypothetical protein